MPTKLLRITGRAPGGRTFFLGAIGVAVCSVSNRYDVTSERVIRRIVLITQCRPIFKETETEVGRIVSPRYRHGPPRFSLSTVFLVCRSKGEARSSMSDVVMSEARRSYAHEFFLGQWRKSAIWISHATASI